MIRSATAIVVVAALAIARADVSAHSGPPFPLVSDRIVGPYLLSVWTDPDTTDDGTPGGQFWVRIDAAGSDRTLPPETRATVTIRAADTAGVPLAGAASAVSGDITNQFVALNMNREGRFAVHVLVDGPLGTATIDSDVNATYDLRPASYLLALYAMPFVLVGYLWLRALKRRRA